MFDLLLAREAAVLAACAAGAYTDWKTGFIYDWITIPLIIFGAGLNIFTGNYSGLLLGGAVFAIGYALYYTGKLGGGDVKIYSGIALALPELGGGVFVLSVALYSALCAIVFISTFYTLKYLRKGIDLRANRDGIVKAGIVAAMFGAYFYFLSRLRPLSEPLLLIFGMLLFFGGIFLALERGIRKEFFLKKIKLADAEEDEVLALDFMEAAQREKIGMAFKGVLGEKEKLVLAKKGIKEILVYRDLPRLGPFIFIGTCLAILMPSATMLILGGA